MHYTVQVSIRPAVDAGAATNTNMAVCTTEVFPLHTVRLTAMATKHLLCGYQVQDCASKGPLWLQEATVFIFALMMLL